MTVSVTFLGGLGEIGRNCSAVEVEGKIALIDCGLMFPELDMPGVDLVFPDWGWLVERRQDVECVILTHGHEDHIGALGYFLREIPVPVYGTSFSVELARPRTVELGLDAELIAVADNEWASHGPFQFAFIPVAHSVPHGAGVALRTPEGVIVHSGDFKLDPTPVDGRVTDLPAFAALGAEGVRLLLADSTNAEAAGFVPSESTIGPQLRTVIGRARGRVIAACFASHLHRVQQIIDAALESGRYLTFVGRSMIRNTELATSMGVLDVPQERVEPIAQLLERPPHQQMIISTGSQGEPFAAMSLISAGRHRTISLDAEDTVVISATPIPGNETAVSRVISGLLRSGATVVHGRNAHVHVSGHANQAELKTFLNVVKPDAFVPVHGEYRHLRSHADLAEEVGVPEILICEDGDRVILDGTKTTLERSAVPAGFVYLDGSEIGDVGAVIRDRAHLADDGVVVVTAGVDMRTCECIHGPLLDSHGLMDEPEAVLDKVSEAVRQQLVELGENGTPDLSEMKRAVRRAAAKVIKAEVGRRPVIVPVILEF